MGREGGTNKIIAKSEAEYKDLLKQHHEPSKRNKKCHIVSQTYDNEFDAKQRAKEETSNFAKRLDDDYNIAIVVPFYGPSKSEDQLNEEMEPNFSVIDDCFQRVVDFAKCNVGDSHVGNGEYIDFAHCSKCKSQINIDVLTKKRERDREDHLEGICPICYEKKDDYGYYKDR